MEDQHQQRVQLLVGILNKAKAAGKIPPDSEIWELFYEEATKQGLNLAAIGKVDRQYLFKCARMLCRLPGEDEL